MRYQIPAETFILCESVEHLALDTSSGEFQNFGDGPVLILLYPVLTRKAFEAIRQGREVDSFSSYEYQPAFVKVTDLAPILFKNWRNNA